MGSGCVPEAKPVKRRPMMIMGTLLAMAIKDQPMTPGMAAIFMVFNLPMLSMMKPPIMAPTGTINTITLAVKI